MQRLTLKSARIPGSEFEDVSLDGSRFHDVNLTGTRINGILVTGLLRVYAEHGPEA
jgi:uncharacterized protein YjbI with pentapeptide repeats